MQAILANLLENFEFSLPTDSKNKIYRKPAVLMVPMTDDYPGVFMGLKVKSVL
jgi:hypothetical protein